MLVKFHVDLNDEVPYTVVVSCRTTVQDAMTLLRRRLNCLPLSTKAATGTQLCEYRFGDSDVLPSSSPSAARRIVFTLQVRDTQGGPVPLTQSLSFVNRHKAARDAVLSAPSSAARKDGLELLELVVLVEGSDNALRLLRIVLRQQQHQQRDSKQGSSASPTAPALLVANDQPPPSVFQVKGDGKGTVERHVDPTASLNNNNNNVNHVDAAEGEDEGGSETSSDGGDDEVSRARRAELNDLLPRLHFMKIDRKFRKAFTTRDAALGGVVAQECPVVSVAYPLQLVNAVRSSEKLMGLPYSKAFTAASTIEGVSDEDYAKYLSIAMTHGLAAATGGRYEVQIALYQDLNVLPHSCFPNCVFERQRDVAPYFGRVRCVVRKGLTAGSEATVFRPHLNYATFALLSKDRRQQLLRSVYHMDDPTTSVGMEDSESVCSCSRCWRWSKDRNEQAMSGAYYVVPSPKKEESGGSRGPPSSSGWALWNAAAGNRDMEHATKQRLADTMRGRFQTLKLVEEEEGAGFPSRYRGSASVEPSSASSVSSRVPNMLRGAKSSASIDPANASPASIRAAIAYAKELFLFVKDFTARGSFDETPTDAALPTNSGTATEDSVASAAEPITVTLVLAKYHWRLNLARYRLLEVLDWLREAESTAVTTTDLNNGGDDTPHDSPQGLHRGKVPFSKLLFDMLLSQLEAEQLFLPDGHPLRLDSYGRWRRLVNRLPASLAGAVQKAAAASKVMSWDSLKILADTPVPEWSS